MTWDILLEVLPNYEPWVASLLLALWQFGALAVLLTWVSNIVKKPLAFLREWFFLVPMFFGVWLIVYINIAFDTLFALTLLQAIFFWAFTWLWSIGLYKLWLGNTEENKTKVILESKKKDSIHDTESLPQG